MPSADVAAWKAALVFHGACELGGSRTHAQSAEDGSFELVVRGSGSYCVTADVAEHNYPTSVHRIPDEPTYTLDIDLPPVCVSGAVVDASSGAPIGGVKVLAREEWPWPRFSRGSASTSSDGRFHLDIEAGDYTFDAWLDKGGVASEELSVGASGLEGLLLRLNPARSVQGRVVDE